MQTEIYTDANGFELLASEWDDLLERSEEAPFFMRHAYQKIWWKHLGNDDLLLIAVRTDDGKLVGLAPLYAKENSIGLRELSFVGCVDVSDYLDLLVDRDYVEQVYAAFIDALERESARWDGLYLCSLPQRSITHTRFVEAAQARGWHVEKSQQDVCPVITLPATWDDYLTGIDKKQRHEIRRKIRKIEREATVNWYAVESTDGLDEAMQQFIDLHQKSTADKEDFWSDSLIAFFAEVSSVLAEAGWLKLYFIEVNDVKAAAMLCFDYNNEFLLYNSGYDPEQFGNLSPGNVLTSYTIQHAIELGRTRYDFLRGDEVYKFRFGAVAEPVYDLRIHQPNKNVEVEGC
jgi:CelD/BcsL family acetyltransferase involved in cellulose biosynthesis